MEKLLHLKIDNAKMFLTRIASNRKPMIKIKILGIKMKNNCHKLNFMTKEEIHQKTKDKKVLQHHS